MLHRAFSNARQAFFVMSSHSYSNLQTNDGHSIICEATSLLKIFFLFFFGTGKIYQQRQGNDIPTIILNLLK